jgi:radical SAM superfamily enzyme YgiQ (UPF0313 family)
MWLISTRQVRSKTLGPSCTLMRKIFLLSPAKITGVRAGLLLKPGATFALARQFQRAGLPLADIFSFASGLYFRGKITYARRFAGTGDTVRIITSNAGLVEPERHLRADDLRAFGADDIHEGNPRYLGPLRRDALALAQRLLPGDAVILLGSIATAKYRDVLLECFGAQLQFPADFVGRGDMSRGALLLRAAAAGAELPYRAVEGAVVTGRRAPRVGAGPRPIRLRMPKAT